MDVGENFSTLALGAGQASPKTVENGGRPASQKGPQKVARMEPKLSPKWEQNGAQNGAFSRSKKLQKPLFSLCFRSKRPPEGGPKRAQKRSQNGPEMSQNLGPKGAQNEPKRVDFGSENGRNSIDFAVLQIWQNGGLENF